MKTILAILFFVLVSVGVKAQNTEYINKTIIFKLKQSSSHKSASVNTFEKINLITEKDFSEIRPVFENSSSKKNAFSKKYDLTTIYKIELKSAERMDLYIQKINRLEEIEYAEPYPIAHAFYTPNDPLILNQYYLNNIKAFDAFNYSKGDTTIVIGIVDSGTDLLHDDLKANYKYNYNDLINGKDDDEDGYIDNFYGWDVADNDFNPQSLVNDNGDVNNHGTNVAGLASAVTNNLTGIASIGYNTKILPIKAMNNWGNISAGYEGIVYAADHGCQIINCSWGSNTPSKFAQDVINYATFERGSLVVAAAGNTAAAIDKKPYTLFYPASYENVMSVAATGPKDMRWSGSSYAITVDVSAPGEGMYTTQQFNSYRWGSGTSFASPLVAGLAGLVKAVHPEFTPKQLAEQIRITADVIDTLSENIYYSKQLGYGRINAYRALTINNLPSIRLDSVTIKSTRKNKLSAGDTLEVTFIATNYLSQVTNTTLRLTCNSEYIVPIENIFKTGGLKTFETVNNLHKPLLMEVKKEIPFNEKVWFIFEMKDEGYDDYQVVEEIINKNYIDINENNIITSLTSNGTIGYADSAKNLGAGYIYDEYQPILNYGGIIIANSEVNMATSILDDNDFNTVLLIDTLRNIDHVLTGKTEYETSQTTGLPLAIIQTTKASLEDQSEPTLTYFYTLKNKSNLPIEGLKVSHFMDWNLYSNTENQIGFVRELNLAYTYSNTDKVIYAGICLLNDMKSVPFAFDLILGGNGGIDITNGFNNYLKWFTMNNPRIEGGNGGDSIDVASMLTTDFFTLNANDSAEIAFAHIISENYYDMVNEAIEARGKYQQTGIKTALSTPIKIYPNPANTEINIAVSEVSAWNSLEIYDNNGRLLFTKEYSNAGNISVDIRNFEPGIYILNYLSNTQKLTTKFIKVP